MTLTCLQFAIAQLSEHLGDVLYVGWELDLVVGHEAVLVCPHDAGHQTGHRALPDLLHRAVQHRHPQDQVT